MAQGLDLKNWDEQKSPSTETKVSDTVKKTRSAGSRRIFPPQFKLQVLDSYRNDSDCRGNQRATARKYNIHRRQIQKWLQCEQNLRSCVEEGGGGGGGAAAAAAAKKEEIKTGTETATVHGKTSAKKVSDSLRNEDGKTDTTLNRSAMIYARLSDAERSRDENAVRATLNSETEVYDRRDSSVRLDAWNLKRAAQKLYPSAQEREPASHVVVAAARWSPTDCAARFRNSLARDGDEDGDGVDVGTPRPASAGDSDRVAAVSPESSSSRSRRGRETREEFPPADERNDDRPRKPAEILPKECCKTNDDDDKPIEIFTVQTENGAGESLVNDRPNAFAIGEARHRSLSENFETQKLCDENAVRRRRHDHHHHEHLRHHRDNDDECVVQKYTDSVDGRKFCPGSLETTKNELLCSREADAESNCLPDASVPAANAASLSYTSRTIASEDVDVAERSSVSRSADGDSDGGSREERDAEQEQEEDGGPPPKKPKTDCETLRKAIGNTDDSKSFSPKRKWMQESMQENSAESAKSRSSYSTLPIKQRVKMNLKSAAASATPVDETVAAVPKGVSPNFTIEKLCAKDIKTENVTPPSFQSPAESDCYNWRPETCIYPNYPSFVGHSPLTRGTALPFPPPLLFSHRVIPELVSLHFKQESRDRKISQSGIISRSPEPPDQRRPPPPSLKEERVSDGEEENADIDVLSTTPVEKKSFDFTGYNLGKRRSFSVQFKLTVLDAFYNDKDCNKNQRATARKFNINRRQVQKWLSQESDLRSEGSVKNGKYVQRQRLANEKELDAEETTCKQCPQHCVRKKRESEEVDKTIEVNVKHCTDKACLSRNKTSPDSSSTPFSEGFEFYKGYYQSDLKSANIYDNYLIPENSNVLCHDSYIGWPNLNTSALPVPNYQYMSSWYHNFDYCQEKSKIY